MVGYQVLATECTAHHDSDALVSCRKSHVLYCRGCDQQVPIPSVDVCTVNTKHLPARVSGWGVATASNKGRRCNVPDWVGDDYGTPVVVNRNIEIPLRPTLVSGKDLKNPTQLNLVRTLGGYNEPDKVASLGLLLSRGGVVPAKIFPFKRP